MTRRSLNLAAEQAALDRMTVGELSERYAEVTGETTRTRNRTYLIRRILWRLQANEHGGLSARALARAEELARDADARTTPPRPRTGAATVPRLRLAPPGATAAPAPCADPRLPGPGTAITRRYKGRDLVVQVRADGFEYEGQLFGSLSAVAKAVTGSRMNGFRFFQLDGKP